jgi:hypothetical protein
MEPNRAVIQFSKKHPALSPNTASLRRSEAVKWTVHFDENSNNIEVLRCGEPVATISITSTGLKVSGQILVERSGCGPLVYSDPGADPPELYIHLDTDNEVQAVPSWSRFKADGKL